jgi:hypothetical protein
VAQIALDGAGIDTVVRQPMPQYVRVDLHTEAPRGPRVPPWSESAASKRRSIRDKNGASARKSGYHLVERVSDAEPAGSADHIVPAAHFSFEIGGEILGDFCLKFSNQLTEDLSRVGRR